MALKLVPRLAEAQAAVQDVFTCKAIQKWIYRGLPMSLERGESGGSTTLRRQLNKLFSFMKVHALLMDFVAGLLA